MNTSQKYPCTSENLQVIGRRGRSLFIPLLPPSPPPTPARNQSLEAVQDGLRESLSLILPVSDSLIPKTIIEGREVASEATCQRSTLFLSQILSISPSLVVTSEVKGLSGAVMASLQSYRSPLCWLRAHLCVMPGHLFFFKNYLPVGDPQSTRGGSSKLFHVPFPQCEMPLTCHCLACCCSSGQTASPWVWSGKQQRKG